MDLRALITLLNIPNIGQVRAKKLVEHFGSPETALAAGVDAISRVRDLGPKTAQSFRQIDYSHADEQLDKIAKSSCEVITLWDEAYPPLLQEIYDPPLILHVAGDLSVLKSQSVAMVGTRTPSQYGKTFAQSIAAGLAENGFTIISGMARGIDSESHRGALNAGGKTVAVLGCGLDIIYPRENKDLKQKITENGAVISEFPLGTHPDPKNFPRRNRIISGLSLGSLIVEAGNKSGALITAAYAADQNREVFALPGDVRRSQSIGCNRLIRRSMAALITSAEDILESLGQKSAGTQSKLFLPPPDLKGKHLEIYNILDPEQLYIDDIAQKVNSTTSEILTLLLEMEMDGIVKSLPGKHYVRV